MEDPDWPLARLACRAALTVPAQVTAAQLALATMRAALASAEAKADALRASLKEHGAVPLHQGSSARNVESLRRSLDRLEQLVKGLELTAGAVADTAAMRLAAIDRAEAHV